VSGPETYDHESELLQNIEKFGWQSMSVFDPDGSDPSFTYSVGFTATLQAPEFIVFGLDTGLMHSMLWEVFRQLQDGRAVTDGGHWREVLEGVDCVSKAVHPDNIVPEYVNSAIWYWHHTGHEGLPPVFQLVWPGKLDKLFPWDDACDELVRESQPALYLPRSGAN
jgi:hypothetical protein